MRNKDRFLSLRSHGLPGFRPRTPDGKLLLYSTYTGDFARQAGQNRTFSFADAWRFPPSVCPRFIRFVANIGASSLLPVHPASSPRFSGSHISVLLCWPLNFNSRSTSLCDRGGRTAAWAWALRGSLRKADGFPEDTQRTHARTEANREIQVSDVPGLVLSRIHFFFHMRNPSLASRGRRG